MPPHGRRFRDLCSRLELARAARWPQVGVVAIEPRGVEIEGEEEEIEEEEDIVEIDDEGFQEMEVGPAPQMLQNVEPMTIQAMELAFSALVTGVNPTKAMNFLRLLNYRIPSERAFYNCQRQVCEAVEIVASRSMEMARANMKAGAVISFDGSWDHPRHGSNCTLSVFDQTSKKIIFLVTFSRKVDKNSETYCAVPQLMERDALAYAVKRLKEMPQIVAYVHDNDARARKVITEAGWNIEEKLDPGHVFKCFERHIISFRRSNGKILSDIEDSLKKWFRTLIYSSELSSEQKVYQWINAINHYRGCHVYCKHGQEKPCVVWQHATDAGKVQLLLDFLRKSAKFLRQVDPRFSTQINESFNRRKTIFAPKNVCWNYSYNARVLMAALLQNEEDGILQLRAFMGLPPLLPENLVRFMRTANAFEHPRVKPRRPGFRTAAIAVPPEEALYAYRENPYRIEELGL